MPVKRRLSKRRVDPSAEAQAWSTAFSCGCDYYGDLEAYGLIDHAAVLDAMPAAWARLGRIYIEQNMVAECNVDEPFALRELGEPETCR